MHQLTPFDSQTVGLVEQFTVAFNQPAYKTPTACDQKTGLLRLHLMQEELSELTMGLAAMNPVEVLDALTDLQYVVDGTYVSFGLVDHVNLQHPLGQLYVIGEKPQWGNWPRSYPAMAVSNIERALAPVGTAIAIATLHHDPETPLSPVVAELIANCLNELNRELQSAWYRLGLLALKQSAFLEVHQSNMSKLGPDGKPILNEAGRVVKGPQYIPPNLQAIWETYQNERAAARV